MAEKGGQTHGRAEGTGPVGDVASRAWAFEVPTGSACGWPGGFSQNSVVISVRMIYVLGIRSFMSFASDSGFKEWRCRGEVKVTTSAGHELAHKGTF